MELDCGSFACVDFAEDDVGLNVTAVVGSDNTAFAMVIAAAGVEEFVFTVSSKALGWAD
jgi:hypothetical protein